MLRFGRLLKSVSSRYRLLTPSINIMYYFNSLEKQMLGIWGVMDMDMEVHF